MLVTRQPVFRKFWHAVMPLSVLQDGQPHPFTLLGERIVLFLDADGRPAALSDRCCHRTARLSKGRCVGGALECGYHGWTYDRGGRVIRIPQYGPERAIPPDYRTPAFEIALTVAVYTEWQAVLTRPEHLPTGVTAEDALAFLRYLASIAHLQDVHYLWRPFLRDPDDDMLLECAGASGCKFIVTHNVKDFRRVEELHVRAITPADFLNHLRSPA